MGERGAKGYALVMPQPSRGRAFRNRGGVALAVCVAVAFAACASSEGSSDVVGAGASGGAGGSTGGQSGSSSGGQAGSGGAAGSGGSLLDASTDPFCGCQPGVHAERIILLSDDNELWGFDPITSSFDQIGAVPCAGNQRPYSLAVDPTGTAWVIFADTNDLMTVDLKDPTSCGDPAYTPNTGGLGLFGMTFAPRLPGDGCSDLYAHSYSGSGAFKEGSGLGMLARIEPQTGAVESLGALDFDGGELAGTAEGRVFAFAGVEPAKLLEYNKENGSVIDTKPLDGLDKTNASAFAFFGGDIYFFTESLPKECEPCLLAECATDYKACQVDAACNADLECALRQGEVSDACGGSVPSDLISCVYTTCLAECDPPTSAKISQVTRYDYDRSDGPSPALEVAVPFAPIRVVGADSSPCVPVAPPK